MNFKPILLIIPFICLLLQSSLAQSFPNPSFESWDTLSGFGGNYENPTDWTTSNTYTSFSTSGNGVIKTNDSHSGNLAAELSTLALGFAGAPYASYLINGKAVIDSFNSGQPNIFTGGSPVVFTPLTVRGWYKFDAVQQFDSATVIVYLKKWNATTQKSDTVGTGRIGLPPTNNYTLFQCPINLKTSGTTPDTIVAAFFSSTLPINKASGTLWIDDVSFDTLVTRTPPQLADLKYKVYSQSGTIRYEWKLPPGYQKATVTLHNLSGKQLASQAIENAEGSYGFASQLPVGIYLVSLRVGNEIKLSKKVLVF